GTTQRRQKKSTNMYEPIQLQTKSSALRNSISRSLVALVTLLLAAIGGVQSVHATMSESSAVPNDTSWVPTGRLKTSRHNHTATLLSKEREKYKKKSEP